MWTIRRDEAKHLGAPYGTTSSTVNLRCGNLWRGDVDRVPRHEASPRARCAQREGSAFTNDGDSDLKHGLVGEVVALDTGARAATYQASSTALRLTGTLIMLATTATGPDTAGSMSAVPGRVRVTRRLVLLYLQDITGIILDSECSYVRIFEMPF